MITPNGRKKKPRLETEKEWWRRLTPKERAEVNAWRDRYHWHPHQVRHSVATEVRDKFGVDFSQALLGHVNLSATQIYAEDTKTPSRQEQQEITGKAGD
ncbi:MAG: tyrosine-type recombinase/integrase [Phycisphaerae bacterium]